ncbi:hypothetical protein ACROYT_G031369 [Oculina patagonica]
MGCSGSQPAQSVSANDSEAIIVSKENSANGNADQLGSAKIDGIETTENLLQDAKAAEGNQLNLTNRSVNRTGQEADNLKRTIAKRDGKEIENAWGVSKVKKNIENVVSKPGQAVLVDFESEYGRDGVDLTSSQVEGDQDKERLISAKLGTRISPDGTYGADYIERMDKQRAIHKEDSEEAFDPSTLIDIEKFKAANAPTKQMPSSNKESETAKVGTDENRNEYDITTNTTNHTEAEFVASPGDKRTPLRKEREERLCELL